MNPTILYYEAMLGQQSCLSGGQAIHFIHSAERNVQQPGFSARFDIYCWVQPGKIVLSYGDAASPQISRLQQAIHTDNTAAEIKSTLATVFGREVKHNIKYIYQGSQPSNILAENVTEYDDYKNFFLGCFPGSKIDWLEEYFTEMAAAGTCVAVYHGGRIVSCTDAPTMPYLSELVQEIGINTLPGYMGRGYAAAACAKAAQNIMASGKAPQWSHDTCNIASQKLAEKIGFAKLAEVLAVTI
ncbi:MAG: GNAT family N-acetyltransferase [Defluviitaleaceae bacterium]|nr:GNAT family N-acetyltransferase [Defluviitaleaceae bacterium]